MPEPAPFTFADLFAGIGGFHAALHHAGGRCVYVSEIDAPARAVYERNWLRDLGVNDRPQLNGDINQATPATGDLVDVPEGIDVLTAGFPCQPFSKSGYQLGMDEARGTLFWNIARVVEQRRPSVLLLENVRNLVGPRHTHEWDRIINRLYRLGYQVSSTATVFSPHLLPPERGGTPQVRDRVFILATNMEEHGGPEEPSRVEPTLIRGPVDGWDPMNWKIGWALDEDEAIEDVDRYRLSSTETGWIDFWDELIAELPEHKRGQRLPGFPLWADHWVDANSLSLAELEALPRWKADFLVKNALFYEANRSAIDEWKRDPRYASLPPSRRKLEWQAQHLDSLWDTVMHFRPSGIRCKQPTYLPALVAITQTSIIGPRRRRITPHEAARLQGMPRSFTFGGQRDVESYRQVGNGVAVGAAWHVLRAHVEADQRRIPQHVVDAVLNAPLNPYPDRLAPAAYEAPAQGSVRAA